MSCSGLSSLTVIYRNRPVVQPIKAKNPAPQIMIPEQMRTAMLSAVTAATTPRMKWTTEQKNQKPDSMLNLYRMITSYLNGMVCGLLASLFCKHPPRRCPEAALWHDVPFVLYMCHINLHLLITPTNAILTSEQSERVWDPYL